jgi:ATP-binding cassette subfamily F protein uup
VDHLLVLEGGGLVRDFPGNYSQYRDWLKNNGEQAAFPNEQPAARTTIAPSNAAATSVTPKKELSYKEKREFEGLEQDIVRLTREKQEVTEKLNSGDTPFDELQKLSVRIGEIAQILDHKELRWLELSELGN